MVLTNCSSGFCKDKEETVKASQKRALVHAIGTTFIVEHQICVGPSSRPAVPGVQISGAARRDVSRQNTEEEAEG